MRISYELQRNESKTNLLSWDEQNREQKKVKGWSWNQMR